MPWLINAAQLDKFRKSQKNIMVLDASWHHDERDAKQEFLSKHIPDAKFFDITALTDKNPEAHHQNMVLLDEKIISEKLSALGLRNDYKIVLYDNSLLHTACRALWMLRLFGHNPHLLYILDGGLHAWEQSGGKVEGGEALVSPKQYTAKVQLQHLRTLDQMKTNLHHPKEQVLDARHALRYAGGPEIRPNLRAGHIPGSFCFPFTTVFDKNQYWKPLEKIRQQLTGIGFDLKAPAVTMCGSGTTAAVLNFVLDMLGVENHALYNGSWTEWGAEKLYPGETSLEERPVEKSVEKQC